MMTFDELWPVLGIPGEFDAMDQCDQMRWRGVLQQAFDAGQADAQRTAAVWENEAREQALQALASEGQWIEHTGAQQKRIAELEAQRQWLPIETAPRQRRFLALVDGLVRFVAWGKTSHVPMYGWCLVDQGAEDSELCEPTHWMPLPPLPVERAHGIEEVETHNAECRRDQRP